MTLFYFCGGRKRRKEKPRMSAQKKSPHTIKYKGSQRSSCVPKNKVTSIEYIVIVN